MNTEMVDPQRRHHRMAMPWMFFLSHVPIGITLPFMGVYWRETIGLSEREIGLIFTVNALTMISVTQIWGYLADVVFSRKRLLIFNCVATGLLIYTLVWASTFWSILVLMFFITITSCALSQTLHGLLLSFEDGHERFGGLRALSSLGFVVANMAVGALATSDRFPTLAFIFPLLLAAYFVQAIVALALRDKRQVHSPEIPRPRFIEVQKHFLAKPDIVLLLVFIFLYNAAHGLSYTFQVFVLTELGASNDFVAMCYSFAAILELPIFFASGWLIARMGIPFILALCALIQSARWFLVWGADSKWDILWLSTSHCLTFGLFFAATVHALNHAGGVRYKASAQTLLSLVGMGLAAVFGNYLGSEINAGGWLSEPVSQLVQRLGLEDRGPLRNLYLCSGSLAAVSLVILVPYIHYRTKTGHLDNKESVSHNE
jgi:PPP family 3-phenylpropionic acid transporter